MSIGEQISRLTPYARRLLEDDYLHERIADGLGGVRKGSRRAKRTGARRAVLDRGVLHRLTSALSAATEVMRVLQQPERRKRRPARTIALMLVIAAATSVVYREVTGEKAQPDG